MTRRSATFQKTLCLRTRATAALGLLAAVCTSGCTVHSVDTDPRPEVEADRGFVHSANRAPTTRSGRQAEDWWKSFRERKLDRLIGEALRRNPQVHAAGRRIEQANLELLRAGAVLFPVVDARGGIEQRWDVDRRGEEDRAELGFLLDWELDAWGRIRSGRDARAREAVAAFEDWRTARLLLSAAVAESWFELVEQHGQRRLAGEQIELSRTLLHLTRLRFGQGQSSVVAVLQQQELLESTEARVPDIDARIEALELVLDALTGKLPVREKGRSRPEVAGAAPPGPPPPLPPTGLASDLLIERPDLRAQRARIIALDHEVGEALADRLPRFSIGGSLGAGGSSGLEQLVGDAIAGAIAPVFDAGSRRAEVERRQSRLREELDLFADAFLDAVREVETALSSENRLKERVRLQEIQLGTARKLLTESKNRFTQGASDYLPVLDALSKVQELERNLLTSRRERLSARVALHRALGGPMSEPQP